MKNKNYLIFGVLIILLICIIFILLNKNGDKQGKIKVTGEIIHYGSDLEDNEQNKNLQKKNKTYNIELNKKITFIDDPLGLEFTVVEIKNDGIKIKTQDKYVILNEDDSRKSSETKDEFFIQNDNSIKIATPSMDAGGKYKIEIIK